MSDMRILVAEDEKKIASFIKRGLKEQHYVVDVAHDGMAASALADVNEYDLVILDVMLPGKDGFSLCREIRANKPDASILMVTARDAVKDKVRGLEGGADDYLTKPFAFDELLARVRALMRRRGSLTPTLLKAADLEMDIMRHKVQRKGKEVTLTSREFALLELFMRNINRVVTRTMLAESVWEHDFDPMSNVIDVYVARVRSKVDDGFSKKLLQTVRGRGYMLEIPEE